MRTLLAVLALAVTLAALGADTGKSIGRVAVVNERLCSISNDSELASRSPVTTGGYRTYQQWIANPTAQVALREVERRLDRFHGQRSDNGSFLNEIGGGVIGVVPDQANQKLLIAVDPTIVSPENVRDEIAAVATPFSVEIRPSCHSVAELTAADSVLNERKWHERAPQASYGFYLDPSVGRIRVTFGMKDEPAASALANRLSDDVIVEYGTPSRLGRLNDGEPHYGGAGIGTASGNICTSAFTVSRNGVHGSITAAHCFNNGVSVYSGSQYYGLTKDRASFPAYDMIRIAPNGEAFDNKIHSDPGDPTVRTVVDAGNTSVGAYVCLSGMITRSICGIEVTSMSASFCDASGCTKNLGVASKSGTTVARPGDSGGPVYNRYSPDPRSAARGMIIAQTQSSNVYFQKITTIQSVLDITVVKS